MEHALKLKEKIKGLRYLWFWSYLRALQGNRIVRSTYIWLVLVPVVAKATHGLEEMFTVEIGGATHTLDLTLPFAWQVFFLSALLFTIGNVVLVLFCPRLIQEYRDFGQFLSSGGTLQQLEVYKDEEYKGREGTIEYTKYLAGVQNVEKSDEAKAKELFWDLRNHLNETNRRIRIAVGLLYSFGLLLFVWVAAGNIIWALGSMFF